jgi:hypothetical protein
MELDAAEAAGADDPPDFAAHPARASDAQAMQLSSNVWRVIMACSPCWTCDHAILIKRAPQDA